MIEVTRMNNTTLMVNSDLIEFVEETPDTLITMSSGHKIIVKESRQEIKNRVILYKSQIFRSREGIAVKAEPENNGRNALYI